MILKNRLGKNKKLVITNNFAKWILIANCQLTISSGFEKANKNFLLYKIGLLQLKNTIKLSCINKIDF